MLTASGGDAGNGPNPNIFLAAMLGPCNALPSTVNINEVSTAAAAYAFAQFFDQADPSKFGANGAPGSSQYIGIANSGLLLTTNLMNIPTGAAAKTLAAYPASMLNTIADLLVYCVNSSSPYTNCNTLFDDVLPAPGGTTPTNTMEAALDIALSPGQNVDTLFGLLSSLPVSAPFTPMLGSVPDSFVLALTYSPSGANGTRQINFDLNSNVWFTNQFGNNVTELNTLGAELSPTGGYTASGALNGPDGLRFDQNEHLWITDYSGNSVVVMNTSGIVLTGPFGSATMINPEGLSLDTYNQVWVANSGSGIPAQALTVSSTAGNFAYYVPAQSAGAAVSVVGDKAVTPNIFWVATTETGGVWRFVDDGTATISGMAIPGGCQGGQQWVTLDNNGDAWVTNNNPGIVTKLHGTSVAVGPLIGGGISDTSDPFGIVADSNNNVWVLNSIGNSVTELNTSGDNLSPSTGFTAGGAINSPENGIGVDRSGNVWIGNVGNNTITEFVGIAGPVASPKVTGRPAAP